MQQQRSSNAMLASGHSRTLLTATSLFCIVLPSLAGADSSPQCVAPPEITRLDIPLRRTAEQLGKGHPLTIVALGSSSTAGAGASSPAMSYPARLEVELARLLPSHRISVLNRGIGGELAIDMLARFDQSVAAEHPDLVLWQLGTNAVLRGHGLLSASLVRDGVARMKGIDAEVILIDPQFAPKVIVKADIADMIDLISAAAKQENVNLFHRFALMRHWHDMDGLPFEAFVSPDGLHMNDWSYGCLAKVLAGAITAAFSPGR
jgi:lysophospholipase L1-like esterase